MSRIVEFRDRIVDFVKIKVPELREVNWYDGLFDEKDLREWTAKPPCAFISLTNADQDLVSTGEVQVDLDCVIVVLDRDSSKPRNADARVWGIIEKIAVLLRLQRFGDPDAAPACHVRFKRLKDPVMRREGVAIGVVTWGSGLTLGDNVQRREDTIFDTLGDPIPVYPHSLLGRMTIEGSSQDIGSEGEDLTKLRPSRLYRDTSYDGPEP